MPPKKKASKNLVPVGTYIPTSTMIGLTALVESRDQSVYEYLQNLIEDSVKEYTDTIDKLKKKKPQAPQEKQSLEEDGSDLLA